MDELDITGEIADFARLMLVNYFETLLYNANSYDKKRYSTKEVERFLNTIKKLKIYCYDEIDFNTDKE